LDQGGLLTKNCSAALLENEECPGVFLKIILYVLFRQGSLLPPCHRQYECH